MPTRPHAHRHLTAVPSAHDDPDADHVDRADHERRAVAATTDLLVAVSFAITGGWLPDDLGRWLQRADLGVGLDTASLLVDLAVLAAVRQQATGQRPPAAWARQLDRRDELLAGRPDEPADALHEVVRTDPDLAGMVARLVWRLPAVQPIAPLPGQWPPADSAAAAGVGGGAGAGAAAHRTSGVDERVLHRVRALLAKAERTDFPEEATAFTAKAQELITRHAIDLALLRAGDAAAGSAGPLGHVSARRIPLDAPYATAKHVLLDAIGRANGCAVIAQGRTGFAAVIGDEPSLDAVELLFTSLLVQATSAMVAAGDATAHRANRTAAFRRAFLVAFGQRIGERLEAARAATVDAAGHADRLLPVLADADAAVQAVTDELFPHLTDQATRVSDGRGWDAGRAAAERADLGDRPHLRANR